MEFGVDAYDDEQIARAIALSLQESQMPHPHNSHRKSSSIKRIPHEVIEIDDSSDTDSPSVKPIRQQPAATVLDDDEARFQADLQRALEASKAEASTATTTTEVSTRAPSPPGPPVPTPSANPIFAGIDRAQLERDRLARQKRLRPDLYANAESKTEDGESDGSDDEDKGRSTKSHLPSQAKPQSQESTLYWEGEIRQTANKHVDASKDVKPAFRLSELIGPKDDVQFAILSAYCVNFPWLYGFFKPETPVVIVAHDVHGNETIKEVLPNWIKTTPFLRGGRGCMHMKFMLLFYKSGRLRIAVSTANLIEIDWRDIENTVWVQDIRRQPSTSAAASTSKGKGKAAEIDSDFVESLIKVMRAVNVPAALISHAKYGRDLPIKRVEDLRSQYDFSPIKVRLIPSLAGTHRGWPEVIQNGHTRLLYAIKFLGLGVKAQGKQLSLECQGSSIGTYSTSWVNEIFKSCEGDDKAAEKFLDISKNAKGKLPWPKIKILFPTKKTVVESVLGELGGGTMFCRRNQWEGTKFPRDLFHDSKSKRGKVLMHSKMILGVFRESALSQTTKAKSRLKAPAVEFDSDSDDDIVEVDPRSTRKGKGTSDENDSRKAVVPHVGWVYIGSHNFTPSAWGTLSGSGFNPTLNVTNFELGILVSLRTEEELNNIVCWERPPKKYVLSGKNKDQPWIQSESPLFIEDGS
ncbi:tyrosyl-DNA phosphodiesterase family protein [Abortiporus biennis]